MRQRNNNDRPAWRRAVIGACIAVAMTAPRAAGQGGIAYFFNSEKNEVSRIDLATGAVSGVTQGLGLPTSLALDNAETRVYVVEAQTGELSSVDLATGAISVVCDGLDATSVSGSPPRSA